MASRLTANGARTASIQARAVHLAITPRPANVGESREIYRIVSRFGDIDYYKNLQYDPIPTPGKAFVVFRTERAAADCISRSPIRFTMGRAIERVSDDEQEELEEVERKAPSAFDNEFGSGFTSRLDRPRSNAKAFGLGQSRSMSTKVSLEGLPTPQSRAPFFPSQLASNGPELSGGLFQIRAHAADKDMRSLVERGHYHGGFLHDFRSVPNEDLRYKVPVVGFANLDFRKETKAQRFVDKEKQDNESYIRSLPFGPLRELVEEHQRNVGDHTNLLPTE